MSSSVNNTLFFISLAVFSASISTACTAKTTPLPTNQSDAVEQKDDKNPAVTSRITPPDNAYIEGFAGHYLAGLHARNQGNISKSIYHLRKAYLANPRNMMVATQLQAMLLTAGSVDQAVTLASEINASEGTDVISTLLMVLQSLNNDNIARASELFEQADKHNARQLWLPLIVAWVNASQQQLKEPLALKDLPIVMGRTEPLVHYHIALINSYAGHHEAAAKHFEQAIAEQDVPPTRIMSAVKQFHAQHAISDVLAQRIKAAKEHKNDYYTPINNIRSGVAEVLFTMGGIMLEAGVTQDAAIYLQLALYLHPQLDNAALALGGAYKQFDQLELANAAYKKVSRDPTLVRLAELYIALNYNEAGDTDRALNALDDLAEKDDNSFEAYVAKGDILRTEERYEKAIDAYSDAIERIAQENSHHWMVYFARGASQERLGNHVKAEEDIAHALTLSPEQPDALNFIAYSWITRGHNIDKAHDMLERALSARPNSPQIIDSMGWVLYLKGQYKQSATYLEHAAELLPNDPVINDHLGDVYWRLGRVNEARFQWQRALSYDPAEDEIKAIETKLEAGLPPVKTKDTPRVAQRDINAAVTH